MKHDRQNDPEYRKHEVISACLFYVVMAVAAIVVYFDVTYWRP